jgi:predicted NUDIX family phosphoesterase
MTPVEDVLVFPEWVLCTLPDVAGYRPLDDRSERTEFLDAILDEKLLSFMPRAQAEEDESYKQLIPYVIFTHKTKILCYTRTKKSGEGRLRSKNSIGFGGHINDLDGASVRDAYQAGIRREMEEELVFDGNLDYLNFVGCIYDDSNDVGRVHFGMVYVLELDSPEVDTSDPSITDLRWLSTADLIDVRDRLENWSQMIVDSLGK